MGRDYEEVDWDNWSYDENDNGTDLGEKEEILVFKDANGNILEAGDTIVAIKDLPLKGGKDIKRGDKFKNIRLTDDITYVESGKLVLKCEFFKKI